MRLDLAHRRWSHQAFRCCWTHILIAANSPLSFGEWLSWSPCEHTTLVTTIEQACATHRRQTYIALFCREHHRTWGLRISPPQKPAFSISPPFSFAWASEACLKAIVFRSVLLSCLLKFHRLSSLPDAPAGGFSLWTSKGWLQRSCEAQIIFDQYCAHPSSRRWSRPAATYKCLWLPAKRFY